MAFKLCVLNLFTSVLLLILNGPCSAFSVQVGSRAYRDFERLEVKGLIESGMLSTRPFHRKEGIRLLEEAERNLSGAHFTGSYGRAVQEIERLKKEFELDLYNGRDTFFFNPLEESHLGLTYFSSPAPGFADINNNGDKFKEGQNLRAGFSMAAGYSDTISGLLSPEYRADAYGSELTFLRAYVEGVAGGLDWSIGRDSLWWGPGYHGTLLLTNNAKPLEMARVTSEHPFVLPWVFRGIGLLKPTLFLARLEQDRDFPRANLLGMRLDMKPTPNFQFALSRVFLFGGKGRESLSASDWAKVFFASDSTEHGSSPINGDQIVSAEASYVYVNKLSYLPFSGVKLYAEVGAEDSSGKTRTPTGRASVYGAYIDEPFRIEDLDLRIEWANTAHSARYGPQWYTHGVYTTGYKYEGDFIGHHVGTDGKDLFTRVQYHAGDTLFELETDFERSGVHGPSPVERRSVWAGVTVNRGLFEYKAGAGMETGPTDNVVVWGGIQFAL